MQSAKQIRYRDYKTSGLNDEQHKIQLFIEQQKIEWLCHYTPRQNLESIKNKGLKLRDPAFMKITEDPRADDCNNICLTISEPNYKDLFDKNEQGHDLVLLLISPNILYYKKCLFYPHKPAALTGNEQGASYYSSAKALQDMFSDKITYQGAIDQEEQTLIRQSDKASYLTTSNQAEVQVQGTIAPHYIFHLCEGEIPANYAEIRSDVDYTNLQKLEQLNAGNFQHLFKSQSVRNANDLIEKKHKRKPVKTSSNELLYILMGLLGFVFLGMFIF